MHNRASPSTRETTQANTPSLMSYTCFLLPRDQKEDLTRSLSGHLRTWLQDICASQNWNLELVVVQCQYLQWALYVLPEVTILSIVQEVRTITSENINNSGHFAKKTSEDFWARGYLAIQEIRPTPQELIEQYIKMTRQ